MTRLSTDVVIVGAGPVGLFAVFACGQLGMRTVVIDALEGPGGQCTALYPDKPIYDIPSRAAISGVDLIDCLLDQAAPYEPQFVYGDTARRLDEVGERSLSVTTDSGVAIDCRAVFLAAGAGAFGPNRPPLAGIETYEGQAVFYHVARRDAFIGKRVVIAGGGDSAVDWALVLAGIADTVTVVHRRPKFRAAPASVARLQAMASDGRIQLAVPGQLHGLVGDGDRLDAVTVAMLDGGVRTVSADALLPFYGLSTDLGAVSDWGLVIERNAVRVDPTTLESDRAGVHAIGDVAGYPGKLKLILNGFAEAAMAAHAAHARVFPDQPLHFEYSTTRGVPQIGAATATAS